MTIPGDAIQQQVNAWLRKRLLDEAVEVVDRVVLAMRAEGISDETAARVLNRITLGVPDPDQVITPSSEGMLRRARRAAEAPLRRPQ